MKMTKQQLEQFEAVLKERKYKKQNAPYKGDFEWFNNIIKTYDDETDKNFALCISFRFWDFSKYENYYIKKFPIEFEIEIVINDNTITTYLNSDFFGKGHGIELFTDNNLDSEGEYDWYIERNASKEEINDYIAALEETAYKFKAFYEEHLREIVFKNFRKQ